MKKKTKKKATKTIENNVVVYSIGDYLDDLSNMFKEELERLVLDNMKKLNTKEPTYWAIKAAKIIDKKWKEFSK